MKKKNILITGANRGLGLYLSEMFMNEGHNLFLLSRSNKAKNKIKKINSNEQKIIFSNLDLNKKNEIIKIKNLIKKKFKDIDIVINSAATQGPIGLFHKNNFNLWEKTIYTNLINTAYLIKILIPFLKKNKPSCVINISGGGSSNSRKFFSSYSVAKTGIVRLTENLAEEYKKYGIKFYAIAPGVLNTKMYNDSIQKEKKLHKIKRQVFFSDMNDTFELIKFLSNNNVKTSGKIISAIWDKWKSKKFLKLLNSNKDFLTLRRIIK